MTHQSADRTLQLTIRYQGREILITLKEADCPMIISRTYLERLFHLPMNTLKAISGKHFILQFRNDTAHGTFWVVDHSTHGTLVEHPDGKAQPRRYHQESFSVGQRSHVRLQGRLHYDGELDHDVLFELVDLQGSHFGVTTEPNVSEKTKSNWDLFLRYLNSTQTVHLTGMPGIGKSWLAGRLTRPGIWRRERAQQLGDVLVIWVDGAAVSADEVGFWRHLAEHILLGLRQALFDCSRTDLVPEIDPILKHLKGGWVDQIREVTGPLMNALSVLLRKANLRPILIFDNFDQLYAKLQPRMLYTLYQLHHEIHELKGKISFVLITRDSFAQLRSDLSENEVRRFNSLFQKTEMALSYLQEDQFSTLLSRLVPGQHLAGTQAANVLYQFSGGHPALTEELCKMLSVEGILNRPHLWHDRLQKMDWATHIPASCEEVWLYLNAQQRQAVADYANGKLSFHQMPSRYKMNMIFPKGRFFSPIFKTCVLHWGQKIEVPGLRIDPQEKRVFVHGKDITEEIHNRKEYCLLFCMYEHRGKLCTYEQLWRHCWPQGGKFDLTLEHQRIGKAVNRLCGIVDPDRKNPKYIISQPGEGYRLEI